MAIVLKEKCKLCRREGRKLFLKGEKCLGPKCTVLKRPFPPGQSGMSRRSKPSDYALALREKQKVKRMYGLIEGQFRNYFKKADKKEGVTGEILLQLLEMRLDNVVRKMGFASSPRQARQLVSHAMFNVNGKKVNVPSYSVKAGDKISVRENQRKNKYWEILSDKAEGNVPSWVRFDLKKLEGEVLANPDRDMIDPEIKENLIVELYSK